MIYFYKCIRIFFQRMFYDDTFTFCYVKDIKDETRYWGYSNRIDSGHLLRDSHDTLGNSGRYGHEELPHATWRFVVFVFIFPRWKQKNISWFKYVLVLTKTQSLQPFSALNMENLHSKYISNCESVKPPKRLFSLNFWNKNPGQKQQHSSTNATPRYRYRASYWC